MSTHGEQAHRTVMNPNRFYLRMILCVHFLAMNMFMGCQESEQIHGSDPGIEYSKNRHEVHPGDPWRYFRHDPQNTARTSRIGPRTGHLAWKVPLQSKRYHWPSLTVDGEEHIYINTRNHVAAFNNDGSLLWDYQVEDDDLDGLALGPDGTLYTCGRYDLYAFHDSE